MIYGGFLAYKPFTSGKISLRFLLSFCFHRETKLRSVLSSVSRFLRVSSPVSMAVSISCRYLMMRLSAARSSMRTATVPKMRNDRKMNPKREKALRMCSSSICLVLGIFFILLIILGSKLVEQYLQLWRICRR